MTTSSMRHALRLAAVLGLLGAAAFPIYWMFVTSLTTASNLFAARPQLLPNFAELHVYKDIFAAKPVGTWLLNSAIVAAFPVEESDHLVMITNQGQIIRVPVTGISIQRRSAQGVTVFRLEEGERVVSVERIADSSGDSEE